MRCDIIIPVWNQLESTEECISSIIKNTDYPYRLIIIDNGSDEATRSYLALLRADKRLDTVIVRNEKNMGFVKAANQGLRISEAPYICLMNNDTIAAGGWLTEMVDIMEKNEDIGILNPSSNTSGQFPKDNSIDEYAASLKSLKGATQELYNARGFCMLIKRDVIKKIGVLDEIYDVGYFEETDYSIRAHGAGFRIARAKSSYVYHKENVTFKGLDHRAIFDANERIFLKRWGRRVRIAYLVGSSAESDKVDDIAATLARQGHQVLVFLKKGILWPVKMDHFDIRRFDISCLLFGPASIFKAIKCSGKKRIDIVVTDSRPIGAFFDLFKIFTNSSVLVRPDKKTVIELVNRKSKEIQGRD